MIPRLYSTFFALVLALSGCTNRSLSLEPTLKIVSDKNFPLRGAYVYYSDAPGGAMLFHQRAGVAGHVWNYSTTEDIGLKPQHPPHALTDTDGNCILHWGGKPILVFIVHEDGYAALLIKSKNELRRVVVDHWACIDTKIPDPEEPGRQCSISFRQVIPAGDSGEFVVMDGTNDSIAGTVRISRLCKGRVRIFEEMQAAGVTSQRRTDWIDVIPGAHRNVILAASGCEIHGKLAMPLDQEGIACLDLDTSATVDKLVTRLRIGGVPNAIVRYNSYRLENEVGCQYGVPIRTDGSFYFRNIRPGRYILSLTRSVAGPFDNVSHIVQIQPLDSSVDLGVMRIPKWEKEMRDK